MPLNHPAWIREMKKPVKDQITIVMASPLRTGKGNLSAPIGKTGNGEDPAAESSGIAPMGVKPMAGMSRETGPGDDGQINPNRVAGDVHDGETVLSAVATRAIPDDVREELVKQAEGGNLDVNALREALKIPEKPGFATGTTQPIRYQGMAAPKAAKPTTGTPNQPITSISGGTNQTTPMATNFNSPTIENTAPKAPAANPFVPAPIVGSHQTDIANANIDRLNQVAQGNSVADKNIAAGQLSQFDTGAANSLNAGAQQVAALGNDVPANVKASMLAQEQSGVRSQRGTLQGQIAANEQANAQNAAQQAASLGLQSQGQQFTQGETVKNDALNAAQVLINQGISDQNAGQIAGLMGQAGIPVTAAAITALGKTQAGIAALSGIYQAIAAGITDPNQISAILKLSGVDTSILAGAGISLNDIAAAAAGKLTSVTEAGGVSVGIPSSGKQGSQSGQLYIGADGGMYQNKNGIPAPVDLTDPAVVKSMNTSGQLASAIHGQSENSDVVQAVKNSLPIIQDPKTMWGTSNLDALYKNGSDGVARINYNGQDLLVTVDGTYTEKRGLTPADKYQRGHIVFRTTDGQTIDLTVSDWK